MKGGEPELNQKSTREPPPFRLCLSLPALTACLIVLPLLGAAGILALKALSREPVPPGVSGAVALFLVLVAAGAVVGAVLLACPLVSLARSARGQGDGDLPTVGWQEVRKLSLALNDRCGDCRAASELLRDSEGRFRGYVESMAEGLVVVDREERITFANARFARMLKMDAGALPGIKVACFVARQDHACLSRESDRRKRGLTGKYELEWRREDGTKVPSVVSATPLRDDQGQVAGSFAVVTDLTERRRVEAHLVASERLKALGELAGGVAHDFNNRLTTILGNAQLLLLDKHPDEVRHGLEIIERSAMAGGAMVQGLIAFTRRDATGRREDLEVNALVRDVLNLARLQRNEKSEPRKLRVRLTLRATKAASAYASELREALLAIMVNAFEAVQLTGKIRVSTYDHSEGVAIRVEDTGEGMDKATRSRAFDPFFTTRGPQRTGLGLSIAHGIIRRIDGRINLASTSNESTSVELVIPASEISRPVARINPWRLGKAPPRRVALLTPSPELARSMEDSLARQKIEISVFDTAESLMDALVTRRISVVVADPEQDGIPTAEASRRISPETRVVMITDWPDEEAGMLTMEPSVHRVVRRPFSLPDLIDVITDELSRQKV